MQTTLEAGGGAALRRDPGGIIEVTQHIATSAKRSGVFRYASGRSSDMSDGDCCQERQRLRNLEVRYEQALQRRIEAARGVHEADASVEWRIASRRVWKERRKMARQREAERLDREAAAEAWTWKRDGQMPIEGDFLSAKLGNGSTMEVPREKWAELATSYYRDLLKRGRRPTL